MNKIILNHDQIDQRCQAMLTEISLNYSGTLPKQIYIYPVPRGGVLAAYMLKAVAAELQLSIIQIVDKPEFADIIVDDLIDSGKTCNEYKEAFFDKPFFVLYDKQKERTMKHWVVFPWELEQEDKSADDIPLRLLQYIGEDVTRGGLLETPKRFLKAWEHYSSGYGKDPVELLKQFEDGAEHYNEMVLVKDIPVYSHCEHHLAPFYGVAHVAYIPNGKIVGLSKIPRLVDMFMRRLQVQERLTNQIAETINTVLEPVGVAVVLKCAHSCMIARGVQIQGSTTITSSMQGVFMSEPATRAEFMQLINRGK